MVAARQSLETDLDVLLGVTLEMVQTDWEGTDWHLLAKCVQTLSKNHPVTRLGLEKADGALECFGVWNDVEVFKLLVSVEVVLLLHLLLLHHHLLLQGSTSPNVGRPLRGASLAPRPLKGVE